VANAALDSIPMVVIAGDVPSHYYGKHPHQEVNLHSDASQSRCTGPSANASGVSTRPDLFPEILEKAFALAESGPPRPGSGVGADGHLLKGSRRGAVRQAAPEQQRNCTRRRSTTTWPHRSSKRWSRPSARNCTWVAASCWPEPPSNCSEFVDHMSLPVSHSLMGKGVLPDDHPFILGMTGFWGTKFINDKCLNADLVLGLGTRFAEADCSSWEN
jgi:acetolactate synthase-1/2/3 large subunit